MIRVTRHIAIDEREIEQHFIRASGPGGQNVNKVASAVQIRFNIAHSCSLPDEVRLRLIRLGGSRVTKDGILVIDARRFRTQERNRQDAIERLLALIRAAAVRPKPRRKTKPTLASKQRRLEAKRQRSKVKRGRRRVESNDN
jgi:ribosome-associated protein